MYRLVEKCVSYNLIPNLLYLEIGKDDLHPLEFQPNLHCTNIQTLEFKFVNDLLANDLITAMQSIISCVIELRQFCYLIEMPCLQVRHSRITE